MAVTIFSTAAFAQPPRTDQTPQTVNISPEQLSVSFAAVAKMVEPAVVSIDTKGKVPEFTA